LPKQKQQSLINGALILSFAMLAVKVVGVLFKMPLTNTIGMIGRGYFDQVYQIYTVFFAISTTGLPIAVSRMVSESIVLKRFRDTRAILKASRLMFLIAGVAGTAGLILLARPYIFISGAKEEIFPGIMMIAPAIFFCCLMSCYRGYYEGQRNMSPTAGSQFIEATGKLAVGLVLAKMVMNYGMTMYDTLKAADGSATLNGLFWNNVFVKDETEAFVAIVPWAAAGAVLGVTIGSILGLLFLMARHKIKGDGITRLDLDLSPEAREPRVISKELLKLALPVVVGALILNISNLIDTMTIVRCTTAALGRDFDAVYAMHSEALDAAIANGSLSLGEGGENSKLIATYLFGAYNTGIDFRNLLPTITAGFGISVLPVLAAAWATRNREEAHRSINSIVRLCMLLALPGGFGIAVMARPFLTIIYGSGNAADGISIAVPVLQVFGVVMALLAISTPITNMLQGLGRTDIPVKVMAVCSAVKIICNVVLISMPGLNIYGSIIGTIVFYVLNVSINLYFLKKITGVRFDFKSVLLKPLLCAALCGMAAWSGFGLAMRGFEGMNLDEMAFFQSSIGERLLNENLLASIFAVFMAMVIYFMALLLTKAVTKDDVIGLPKGEKIAKALAKHGLLG